MASDVESLEEIVSPQAMLSYLKSEGRWPDLPTFEAAIFCLHPGLARRWVKTAERDLLILRGPGFSAAALGPGRLLVWPQGFGAAAVVSCLELLWASGLREVQVLGSAGSLAEHLAIGQTCTILAAQSHDEFALAYHAPKGWIKVPWMPADHWARLGAMQVRGWSTGAPFRETKARIRAWRDAGADVVDMESAAIYSWAHYRGVKAVVHVVLSDQVLASGWTSGFHLPNFRDSLSQMLDALLQEENS